MSVALVILAAGKGTRMKSDLPKVLQPLAQAPLLHHAMACGAALRPARTIVVTGHGAERVEAAARAFDPAAETVLQAEQNGTGHAVHVTRDVLGGFEGDALILYGDTPFIRPETLSAMIAARQHADIVVLGFEARDPGGYGRLIEDNGRLDRIVEAKDASLRERAVTLCNSGVLAAPAALLLDLVARVSNENASGEYYLTDVVALARAEGRTATVVRCEEAETLGVNSRSELAAAEAAWQTRRRRDLLTSGVAMQAPETVWLAFDTTLAPGVTVEPNVVFAPGVKVAEGATIRAFSHLEACTVGPDAVVGPYARLRPGADLAERARVGNFVEIKSAEIGPGAKVNHLTYIGDATVGSGANIGAGTVTCNYDGVSKHRTGIGRDAFIGSGSLLVAPVRVGDEAFTATGSVITEDVPDGDLAIARPRQINKIGLARRLMARLRKARENS